MATIARLLESEGEGPFTGLEEAVQLVIEASDQIDGDSDLEPNLGWLTSFSLRQAWPLRAFHLDLEYDGDEGDYAQGSEDERPHCDTDMIYRHIAYLVVEKGACDG